jgi:cysteine desulfurase
LNTLNPEGRPIYLDYNASAPLDPAVLETMISVLVEAFGNPSSQHHRWGRAASQIVENARMQTAALIEASPSEIVFTSGATESCNLAIKGVASAYREKGNHIITSMAEHKAVLEPLKQLANSDVEITLLRPDSCGRITAGQIQEALTERTILVCTMAANNVLGTLNPVMEIAALCKKRGILFFCDATQAAGKIPFSVQSTGVDLAALSAHKMYGPKGSGALYVRSSGPRVRLQPQILGGGQERGLRGGTENVAGIAGMGKACEVAGRLQRDEAARLTLLRNRLEEGILEAVSEASVIGREGERLPNTSLIAFPNVRAERLLRAVGDRIAASTGSACDSATGDSNYVLKTIGLEQHKIAGAIRFSIGRFTLPEHIESAIETLVKSIYTVD